MNLELYFGYNTIGWRFSMASAYHNAVWESEGNTPRNLELGIRW